MTPEEEAKIRLSLWGSDFDKMVALVIAAQDHALECPEARRLGRLVCAIVGHLWTTEDGNMPGWCFVCLTDRPDNAPPTAPQPAGDSKEGG